MLYIGRVGNVYVRADCLCTIDGEKSWAADDLESRNVIKRATKDHGLGGDVAVGTR